MSLPKQKKRQKQLNKYASLTALVFQMGATIYVCSYLGKTVRVLIEKESKKSKDQWSGRNEQNTVVVFDKKNFKVGDFVDVHITDCTSATLIGNAII